MKLKILISLIFIFTFQNYLYSENINNNILKHRDNYLIIGNHDSQIKGQISIKFPLFYYINSGFCLAYTQIFFWRIYDKSAPFSNYEHNPELFFELKSKTNFLNINLNIFDYIRIGREHLSNGEDGDDSRSIDFYYYQSQISYGKKINIGLNYKYIYVFHRSIKNKDIQEYRGSGELKFFIKCNYKKPIIKNEKLYIKLIGGGGKNRLNLKKGAQEIGLSFNIFMKYFRPKLYIQYWNGYGENIHSYNMKETNIRWGLLL